MSYQRRRRITMTVYVDPDQKATLDRLSKVTRVPSAEYVREGIDIVLTKYKKHLRWAVTHGLR
ncbi:MAG: ribbon-helix-helix domain-containing protein [Gammaproteobacteria bacterium]